MSTPTPNQDQAFFDLVTRFLDAANALSPEHHRSRISAALLFAASRYNAFTWMHRDANPEQTPEDAAEFFASHYKAMFRDNLEFLKALAASK